MKELKNENKKNIKGGALSVSSALNALMKVVGTVFGVGQSVGSSIRRIKTGSICGV